MKKITVITRYIPLAIIAILSFSVTHAKDVTSAFSLQKSNSGVLNKASSVQTVDNGIHLDLHTHTHRQTASQLLGSAQHDRPVSSSRELKKIVVSHDKKTSKQPDGVLGQFIPTPIRI